MLIALYFFVANTVVPRMGAYADACLEPVMAIVITLAGIVLLFGSVGVRISNNLGSTVVRGFFGAIGYVVRTIVGAIGWAIRGIFRLVPRVFNGSRQMFAQMGMNPALSSVFSTIIVILLLVVII